MASHHKNKGLVNGRGNAQSSLNLDITGEGNLTGFTVKGGQITDNHGGVWNAVQNSPDGEYAPSPTFAALLMGPGGVHYTLSDIRATQLLWIS